MLTFYDLEGKQFLKVEPSGARYLVRLMRRGELSQSPYALPDYERTDRPNGKWGIFQGGRRLELEINGKTSTYEPILQNSGYYPGTYEDGREVKIYDMGKFPLRRDPIGEGPNYYFGTKA